MSTPVPGSLSSVNGAGAVAPNGNGGALQKMNNGNENLAEFNAGTFKANLHARRNNSELPLADSKFGGT